MLDRPTATMKGCLLLETLRAAETQSRRVHARRQSPEWRLARCSELPCWGGLVQLPSLSFLLRPSDRQTLRLYLRLASERWRRARCALDVLAALQF